MSGISKHSVQSDHAKQRVKSKIMLRSHTTGWSPQILRALGGLVLHLRGCGGDRVFAVLPRLTR